MASASFRFYAELGRLLAPERRGRTSPGKAWTTRRRRCRRGAWGARYRDRALLLNGEPAASSGAWPKATASPSIRSSRRSTSARCRACARRRRRRRASSPTRISARWRAGCAWPASTPSMTAAHEDAIVRRAEAEQRIVLSRDRELLKRGELTCGAYLDEQLPGDTARGDRALRPGIARPSRPACGRAATSACGPRTRRPSRRGGRRGCASASRLSRVPGLPTPVLGRQPWQRMRAVLDALLTPQARRTESGARARTQARPARAVKLDASAPRQHACGIVDFRP